MFYLSKIVWAVTQPSSLIAAVLLIGSVLTASGKTKLGLRLLLAGSVLYLTLGFSPFANWLLIPLELRAARAAAKNIEEAAGIIVLGGAVRSASEIGTEEMQLNDAADRMTEAVRLANAHPAMPVIFTGGDANVLKREDQVTEAELARRFFEVFKIVPPRLRLEDRSRNTFENAVFTARLLQPKADENWVLLTSAFHMPRAKALFEAQGFRVLAWPVDFRTGGRSDRWSFFQRPSDGLRVTDLAAKEWVGLFVSWLRRDIAWPKAL